MSRIALCGSLGTAVAAVAILTIVGLYGQAKRDVTRGLDSLSTVLTDQADRALQALELAQEAVIQEFHDTKVSNAAEYAAAASKITLHEEMRNRISSLPQVNAITVLDHTGKLLNFSRYWPIPPIDLSDRDYFQILAADPQLQRVVSRPYRNRGDGAWTIYIARKVSAPNGTFLGMVLGAVELRYFEDLYRRVLPAEDFAVGLFRNDGVLLARHPRRDEVTGNVFTGSAVKTMTDRGMKSADLRIVSQIDGQDRFIAVRSLENYPVKLFVSRTATAVLAPFRRQAAAIAGIAVLLTASLCAVVFLVTRRVRDREEFARSEERLRGERDLRSQHEAFGVALDNMTQGLCLFNEGRFLVVMNARFAELYAIPVGLRVQGVPADRIDDHIRVHLLMADHQRELFIGPPDGAEMRHTVELGDGRAIGIVRAPVPGGGWVCTHEDITESRRAEERMRFLAGHDVLTGLPNRRLFEEAVGRELTESAAAGTMAALLCIDLDGFKQINDVFGHPAGDATLVEVARRLREGFAGHCVVARLGGDEFALLATGIGGAGTPDALATEVISALSISFELAGSQVEAGCSVGIAVFPRDGDAYDKLLSAADMALFRAKRLGKGTFSFFEPAMDTEAKERHELARDLRAALGTDQLVLNYQPQFEVASGVVSGFEALVRWEHPVRGPVSPAQFIPIAEETGLILPLGEWVLRTACREAAGWERPLGIAVNLSIAQFRRAGLPELVQAVLRETGLDARRLELEITESLFLEDTKRVRRVLNRLKDGGVRIAIDDFGTGYSSLLTLQSFPFDRLKIDRTFVSQIGITRKGTAIVRAVLALGESLGMPVIAEGIETDAQLAFLRRHRCAEMQGYLRGKPRPMEEYRDLVAADVAPLRQISA